MDEHRNRWMDKQYIRKVRLKGRHGGEQTQIYVNQA
jgi:hypothetical protein